MSSDLKSEIMTALEIAELLKKEGIQDVNQAFFYLLMENKVSFTELAKKYTSYLKAKVDENSTLVTELAFSLAMYKDPDLNKGTFDELRLKSNKAIIASRIFQGTPYEQDLIMSREEHYEPEEKRGRKKMIKKNQR